MNILVISGLELVPGVALCVSQHLTAQAILSSRRQVALERAAGEVELRQTTRSLIDLQTSLAQHRAQLAQAREDAAPTPPPTPPCPRRSRRLRVLSSP
jgi:hypothetical protein